MDQITEDGVRRIVEALIEDESMFSLHDVTTLARRDGLTVKHYGYGGVREYVNGLLKTTMFDDYDITLNGEFNIFHPLAKDANNYDKDEHRGASPAAAPTGTVSLSPPTPAFVAPVVDDGKVAVDQRGRLCVRASLLRKLGVKKGDHVFIDVEPSDEERLVITRDGMPQSVSTMLIVDKDNCLRISKGTLDEAFETLPSRFKLEFATFGTESSISIE
jgi:bifunctional DNA-binding transcriptional regulator/antitoxin component of YhaV-PrlF toxin-antitoxin module